MNPRETLEQWFAQLAPRERIMVSVCAVVVVLAGIWSLIINPLFVNTADMRSKVANKEAQLANLQELASRVPAGGGGNGQDFNRDDSIVVVIDRTTRSRQLAQYLKRNQPDGANGVRLRFEGAPFDTLVTWIGELKSDYGMSISTANFDSSATGRVNCSLVINQAG